MKKIGTFILAASIIAMTASCSVNKPDELKGLFSITELKSVEASEINVETVDDDVYKMSLTLTAETGEKVHLDFCGSEWGLKPDTYSNVITATVPGTYNGSIDGEAIFDGSLTVGQAEDIYEIRGVVVNENEEYYRISFRGIVDFGDEPIVVPPTPPVTGTELKSFISLTSYLEYGQNLVGVELGTEGFTYTVTFDWTTFTNVYTYSGDGNYLKLELYSNDGTVKPGTYTASADGTTLKEGEFGIGYDGQYGISGTTWFTVKDNASSHQYVTDGIVNVEVEGDTYTISLESSVVNAVYTGKLSK